MPTLHSSICVSAGVEHIIDAVNLKNEVAFGATKIFIKEPRTLFALETFREQKIPFIVSKIQVCSALLVNWHCTVTDFYAIKIVFLPFTGPLEGNSSTQEVPSPVSSPSHRALLQEMEAACIYEQDR
jgi:hypothetical protein